MALSNIQKVRTILGITENNPFYPILEDDEIEYALELSGGSPTRAARQAGGWAARQIAALPIKEYVGDTEIWTNYPTEYRQALEFLFDDSKNIPVGLMPYFAGISWTDFCIQVENEDNIIGPLEKLVTCRMERQCAERGGC